MRGYSIQTNSGTESSGKVFGIEAKHFIPILYALLISLGLFFFLSISPGAKEMSSISKILLGFSPLFISVGWVGFLVTGKPPHFQEDFFENLLSGFDFNVIRTKKVNNLRLKLCQ